MSENRVEAVDGAANLIEVHRGMRRRLDREISFREPGKWSETLTSENGGEGPGSRVESLVWDAGHQGGNGDSPCEDMPQQDPEGAVAEARAFQWKANRIRARRRRDAARKGAAPGRAWEPVLSPVPAIRFINENGEVFSRPALETPVHPALPAPPDRRG